MGGVCIGNVNREYIVFLSSKNAVNNTNYYFF